MTDEPKKSIPRRPMTEARKKLFIEHLSKFGLIAMACRHASPHAPAGSTKIFYRERDKDPQFKQDWEDAMVYADEKILEEMRRRGMDGWAEETAWGSVHKYSDKLLELYGKVKNSRIRNALNSRVEVSGSLATTGDLGLGQLTPASQELLRQILENEKAEDDTE